MSQNLNVNITLDKTTAIACDSCGNETFVSANFLRKASKFLTGTEQDALIPVPTFACSKCGYVNEEFQLKDLN